MDKNTILEEFLEVLQKDLLVLHLRQGQVQLDQLHKQMYLELQLEKYTVDHLAKRVLHNSYDLFLLLVSLEVLDPTGRVFLITAIK